MTYMYIAAVRKIGTETFRICHQLVDEMITVETDEICAAIKLGFNDTRTVLEPAGGCQSLGGDCSMGLGCDWTLSDSLQSLGLALSCIQFLVPYHISIILTMTFL